MISKRSILLVEDEDKFVDEIRKSAKHYPKFEIVHTTALYQEALDFIHEQRPPIVITDIHLPDESGLNLMRTIRSDEKFSNYQPYIVAITSYASPRMHKKIKDLADDLHIKNDFFNPNKIFIELSYEFEFQEEPLSPTPELTTEPREEELIFQILDQFYVNPTKIRHRQCMSKLVTMALADEDDKPINLSKLYKKVAPLLNFKSEQSVNSLVKRYLDEIIEKTDRKILKDKFARCESPNSPTAKEFFTIIVQEAREQSDNF